MLDHEIDSLKTEYESADMRYRRMKADALHSRNGVTHEAAREACQLMITACYALQRAKWGKVRLKMSIASEMR
jgi:hypothetical protein